MVLLDFNYLSTPKKLLEYQSRYFENELIQMDITNFKKIILINNKIQVEEFLNY